MSDRARARRALFAQIANDDAPKRGGTVTELMTSGGPGSPMALLAKHRPVAHRNITLGFAAFTVGREIYRWVQRRREHEESDEYYIAIKQDDYLYGRAQSWLMEHMPIVERRGLIAESDRDYFDGDWHTMIAFTLDGERQQTVYVGGHEVLVTIGTHAPEAAGAAPKIGRDDVAESDGAYRSFMPKDKRLTFRCQSSEAREAVQQLLRELVSTAQQEHEPSFYVTDKWGSWRERKNGMRRPIESVVLRDGVRERLVDDLRRFLDQEALYERWSIPWHRGYLLHGVPGTGKTSICAALATHFELDIYYLTLSNISDDATLNGLLSAVKERSILVIEDVDILNASHDRTQGDNGVTLAGLINALDGLVTPHGMITMMTTNNVSILDPALTRDGRVDVNVEIEPLDDDQLARLCTYFLERELDLPSVTGLSITAAEALGQLKRHFDDPDAGAQALHRFIEERSVVYSAV